LLIEVTMNILGIETSCDETSAAVLSDGALRSNVISSQFVHRHYGGVVPELASRAHQRLIVPVVGEALQVAGLTTNDLDGIAVTNGPGLMGALLVGVSFAKALSYGLRIPFVGVNHMEAHIYANFIEEPRPSYPFLCLIVSGGHTQLALVTAPLVNELLGETLDDAAGEAFDKVGKMLGLGFPGGPVIDRLASEGDPRAVEFPRSLINSERDDFSFSGIKTSVLYWLRARGLSPGDGRDALPVETLRNVCASFQAAVVDVLVEKTFRAARRLGVNDVAVAGGVSANSGLRSRMESAGEREGKRVFIPRFEFCTDNAAMIAEVGWMKLQQGVRSTYDLGAVPNLSL
jgi:N6-L-threonylcarbamoyladenine synthase